MFALIKDAAVQRALYEHKEITNQIGDIITSKDVQPKQLEILANLVDSHVHYEERELFPHLENVLTEDQQKQIASRLTHSHAVVCSDEFTDEFWVK